MHLSLVSSHLTSSNMLAPFMWLQSIMLFYHQTISLDHEFLLDNIILEWTSFMKWIDFRHFCLPYILSGNLANEINCQSQLVTFVTAYLINFTARYFCESSFFKSPCLIGPIRPNGLNRIIDRWLFPNKVTWLQVVKVSAQFCGKITMRRCKWMEF